MKTHRVLLLVVLATVCAGHLFAQQPDPSVLTLKRIFTDRDFQAEKFGPARWLENGKAYTTVEPSPDIKDGQDIIRYEADSGKRRVLVAAKTLVPTGAKTALAIDDYVWSEDGKQLLIFTNSQQVWRQRTRGDYWVADLARKGLKKLGGDAAPATLSTPGITRRVAKA